MSKSRTEWKVGLFVLIGLVLAAGLIIQFNKSAGPFTQTYRLRLQAKDVSGVIPGSFVLMAGVRIGDVEDILLNTESGEVVLIARLLKKYRIAKDAHFTIRQSGFLGDQYIAVYQGKAEQTLQDGDVVDCEAPFDLGEVARSTGGLIKRVDTMVGQLSNAVARVDTTLLSGEVLTNLALTVADARGVSGRALSVMERLDVLLTTNTPPINLAVSNLQTFSVELKSLATELRETLATNRGQLTASIENIESATARLDGVMKNVEEGKGLVGALLHSEQMAVDMSLIASNIQVLSSNINNKGLWGVIRKPKAPKK